MAHALTPPVSASPLWTEQDELKLAKTHEKIKEIEDSIQKNLSHLIYFPVFEKRYPEVFALLKERVHPIPIMSSSPEIAWIELDVTRHLLKEGPIEPTLYLAEQINLACRSIPVECKNFADQCLFARFLLSYREFLQKNQSQCTDAAILAALCAESEPKANLNQYQTLCDRVDNMLEKVHATAVQKARAELNEYSSFLCATVKAVLLATEALIKPGLCSDSGGVSLGNGLKLGYNKVVERRHEELKAYTSSKEFVSDCRASVEKEYAVKERYFATANEEARYKFACEIMNYHSSLTSFPSSLQLDVLHVISNNNAELGPWFKTLTMRLAEQVNESKKEKAPAIEGCPVM